MSKKQSKRLKLISRIVDKNKEYNINDAIDLAKKTSNIKFDASIELVMRLNVNPKHSDQQIRGSLVLPCGTGKKQKVLVLTTTHEKEALEAEADYVGGENLIEKIAKHNWFDFDIIVATPDIMPKLAKIGKILGPKGLMPNPKTGTVTTDVKKAVEDVKRGKLIYRVDKDGNLHFVIGKVSFTSEDLEKNYKTIFSQVQKVKPKTVKGEYIRNIILSTSMGPSIKVTY